MATVGLVSGTILRLYIGSTAIARATECEISIESEMETVGHKDSAGGWVNQKPTGSKSGSWSNQSFFEEVAGGFAALWSAIDADTAVTIKMTTGVTGDTTISGSSFINSLKLTGTYKQRATFTCSGVFDGTVSKGVV